MKTTALVIVIAAVAVLLLGFFVIEKRNTDVKGIVLISVMTAMSVAGRILFAFAPGFKPVTAIVVLTGMYLGKEAGFICGALTALISNFYFGQGSFTPFQMLVWGLIGIFSGIFAAGLRKNKILLGLYGIIAGVAFSLLMDVYTVIWALSEFNLVYYGACVLSAIPFTITYAVSNVIFLYALNPLMGKKLEHISEKFALQKT